MLPLCMNRTHAVALQKYCEESVGINVNFILNANYTH